MLDHLKFCYSKTQQFAASTKIRRATYAVAVRGKYWDKGYTLKIHFINGDVFQQSQMKEVISELLDYTSLSVEYVTEPSNSDIRISFNYGYGSYSYLGTDARFIPTDQETLNIGWSGKGVMRHEFGHALNLSHEHQNPNGGITWNEAKVIEDVSGAPNYWSESQIRSNILDKYDLSQVDATDFDPDSIMLYYFPNEWTVGDFETNENEFLSETDKQFLQDSYSDVDTIAPVIILNGDDQMTLQYGEPYIELGAEANDNTDGDISNRIQIIGEVDSLDVGIQPIIYSVHDNAGNHTEKIRNVLIQSEIIDEPIDVEPTEPTDTEPVEVEPIPPTPIEPIGPDVEEPTTDPIDENSSNKATILIGIAIVVTLIVGYLIFK